MGNPFQIFQKNKNNKFEFEKLYYVIQGGGDGAQKNHMKV